MLLTQSGKESGRITFSEERPADSQVSLERQLLDMYSDALCIVVLVTFIIYSNGNLNIYLFSVSSYLRSLRAVLSVISFLIYYTLPVSLGLCPMLPPMPTTAFKNPAHICALISGPV